MIGLKSAFGLSTCALHISRIQSPFFKLLMKRKIRYSDYDFIAKNFENDSRTPFTVFTIYRNLRDIEVVFGM